MKHKHNLKSKRLKTKLLGEVLFLAFAFSLSTLSAQQAIIVTGGDVSGSGGTVAYSIGQIDYTTNTSDSGTISQGVQQAFEIYTLDVKDPELNISLSVFPNPTTNNLTLQIQNYKEEGLAYQLYDLQGKMVKTGAISGAETHISLGNLSSATYFLKVVEENNPSAYKQSFKIIKN
ncbi:T9SS type A sorting domain-containing protein [uncultured Marixanthomonas sp.]|uniref:T9SS type A sorting domain-containing protein n=1 Tax=uncultured Marixanthomonas sp. TaxID=757245 RepID=UPI0030DC33C8